MSKIKDALHCIYEAQERLSEYQDIVRVCTECKSIRVSVSISWPEADEKRQEMYLRKREFLPEGRLAKAIVGVLVKGCEYQMGALNKELDNAVADLMELRRSERSNHEDSNPR